MSKYAIWDKKSDIITPSMHVFTAEEWMEQYPAARRDDVKVVCGGGQINGSVIGTLDQWIDNYKNNPVGGYQCDFEGCETDQDYLDRIEQFENFVNNVKSGPTAEERIAAALEAQVMMALPDTNEEEE